MADRKNWLILGANGGIGTELCRRLTTSDHGVILAGRNEDALRALSQELNSPCEVVDATSVDDVQRCIARTAESTGGLDGVVNCVGSLLLKPAHLTSPQEWNDTIATNLTSAFATVRGAFPVLKERGGDIVLLTTAAARTGIPNHEAIAAAKAGVIGLMQSAAATYAAKNIRVNAVAPGLVQTKLTEKIWSNEKAAAASRGMHALGRLGTPADVASLIEWLLSQESSWITGQVFGIDGGLATLRTTAR